MELLEAYIEQWSNYRGQYTIAEACKLISSMLPGENLARLQTFLAEFLARDPYNARLLLYLPFWTLQNPSETMRQATRKALVEPLHYHDVRENYNLGDCYELDARPEKIDRVVKVVHLLPWLIEAGILNGADIIELAIERKNDPVFCQSLLDMLPYGVSCGALATNTAEKLKLLTIDQAAPRHRGPKYNSEKRQAWLAEMQQPHQLELGQITGPFLQNMSGSVIAMLRQSLGDDERLIIRVGGSQVKGYGRSDSDADLYPLRIGESPTKDPELAHLVLNTVWAGHSRQAMAAEQKRHAEALIVAARNPLTRRQILEKVEQDLLQYRIMHKGFPYAYDDIALETRDYPQMDGASAFYDDRYRRVATQLFLKYVFLPS